MKTYTDGEEVTELGLRFRLLLRRENEAIDWDTPSANGSGNVAGWDFRLLALFLPKIKILLIAISYFPQQNFIFSQHYKKQITSNG